MTYKKLAKKFEKDVKELQANCPHTKTEWMKYAWAPGHINGEVLLCLRCNKDLGRRGQVKAEDCITTNNSASRATMTISAVKGAIFGKSKVKKSI